MSTFEGNIKKTHEVSFIKQTYLNIVDIFFKFKSWVKSEGSNFSVEIR